MKKYNAGDMVRLKTGGPRMTVNRYLILAGGILEASWFDHNQNLLKGEFHEDSLLPLTEDVNENKNGAKGLLLG